MLALSHRDLGISWSPFGEVTPAGGLVTGGVYRWVRHPMYASFFLFNIGMLALTSNWLSAPALLGMLWLYFSRVDHEEGMMLRLFGDGIASTRSARDASCRASARGTWPASARTSRRSADPR